MQYPDESEISYWTRREDEERSQANDSALPSRSIHAELADRYAILIAQATGEERKEA